MFPHLSNISISHIHKSETTDKLYYDRTEENVTNKRPNKQKRQHKSSISIFIHPMCLSVLNPTVTVG